MRLKNDNVKTLDIKALVYKSITISNTLFDNDVMSSLQLAKGFSNPLFNNMSSIPKEIVDAQNMLQAQRKLILILKSKSITEIPVNIGDLVKE